MFRCHDPGGNIYHFKCSYSFVLCVHLELQKPFTGFVKPATVLMYETLLWVIFQFSTEKFKIRSGIVQVIKVI